MNEPLFVSSIPLEVQRWVATSGPGYRGQRRAPTAEQRVRILEVYAAASLQPPMFFLEEVTWVERKAKLFEAGEYPDKGATVTEGDLDAMVAHFDLPVGVLIEHSASPLELGFVTQIWREGTALFGTVALTFEADALIRRSKATGLSVGLSEDLQHLQEVSLVRSPRVADARLFCAASAGLLETEVAPAPTAPAEHCVQRWIREGRILPAQGEPLMKLYQLAAQPQFSAGGDLVARLDAFLQSLPAHALFQEQGIDPQDSSSALFLPEERAFYERYFPDVSLDQIAKRKPVLRSL